MDMTEEARVNENNAIIDHLEAVHRIQEWKAAWDKISGAKD